MGSTERSAWLSHCLWLARTPMLARRVRPDVSGLKALVLSEHTVEVVSDSGGGAQKCGQIFGTVSAKMGNGVWTVEIIPAEVEPPPRDPAGASGIRIRVGSKPVTNWGDESQVTIMEKKWDGEGGPPYQPSTLGCSTLRLTSGTNPH